MPAHCEHNSDNAQRQGPPETAREILELRILLVLERRHLGLERHAADRAGAWCGLADLRVHRAGVDHVCQRWRLWLFLVGLRVARRVRAELVDASLAAEEISRASMVKRHFGVRGDLHATHG